MVVKIYKTDRDKLVEKYGDYYSEVEFIECNWILGSAHDEPYDLDRTCYATGEIRFPKGWGYIITPHKVYEVTPKCFYINDRGTEKVSIDKCNVRDVSDINLSKINDEEKRELMELFIKRMRFKNKPIKRRTVQTLRVQNIDTGEIYDSLEDCAEKLGVTVRTVQTYISDTHKCPEKRNIHLQYME